jgi:DNA polymerase-4
VDVKSAVRTRSILHVDLDPFLVSVERSLDPALKDRPVVVGAGPDGSGVVAAASTEARACGVRVGQSIAAARAACPGAVFRQGDLDTYARFSEDVTSILLAASRRVERPSADEAYVDLTREDDRATAPVAAAEAIKDELQRRLGLDASLGLASTRLAARVASTWARPRGLLVVLPGYEALFLARQQVSFLPDLPSHIEAALEKAGFATLGQVGDANPEGLAEMVGQVAAERLQDAARGAGEQPIAVTAPPTVIQEETIIRARRTDRAALLDIVGALASRAARRLRPYDLAAGALTVEVRRADSPARRSETFASATAGEDALREVALALAAPMIDPAGSVKAIQVRLTRLGAVSGQATLPLFPERRRAARRH